MNEQFKGGIRDAWDKSVEFLIKCGGEWLKPRTSFALIFYVAYLYLVIKGLPIPDGLKTIVDILFGFYFGSRVATRINENGGQK